VRIRALGMARQLPPLPRREGYVKIALQLVDFLADTIDFVRGRVGWIGQPAQLGDVALECFDFDLAALLLFTQAGFARCGCRLSAAGFRSWRSRGRGLCGFCGARIGAFLYPPLPSPRPQALQAFTG